MTKISLTTLFITLLLTINSLGQQRIGVDISSRMNNLMLTAHYQKVLKNRFLYSVGFSFGNYGTSFVENDSIRLYAGEPIATPFNDANTPITDSSGTYSILDYNSTARGVGIQFGLGYFHEFDVQHGLRINVNSSLNFVNTLISGYYRSIDNFTGIYKNQYYDHFVGSISLEAYHTIRLTGRLTFNYGLKVPYYFTIDKAKFNPTVNKDLLYGFEPQLSIGLTRVIGKCD